MTPRASANANAGNSLAATFPSAPLPVPVIPVTKPSSPAPKAAPSGTHKAKSSRWLFRRRKRLTTAERNAAQASVEAQEAKREASGVTTIAEWEEQRLAR